MGRGSPVFRVLIWRSDDLSSGLIASKIAVYAKGASKCCHWYKALQNHLKFSRGDILSSMVFHLITVSKLEDPFRFVVLPSSEF